ncbi:MFS transporter [Nocardia sp. FBN12]|uniref:MFS transporter n=1 Tax=Nocardia sp. FBN12 TaxID=3419766 RepID=UPI003D04DB6D
MNHSDGLASPDGSDTSPSLSSRLDRLPASTRSHKIWMVILGSLFLWDVADVHVLAYAAPAIRKEWGLSISDVGVLTSISFLGMFIGALVGGRISDRIGRKKMIIGATVLYSVFTVGCAIAPNFATLGLCRLLTGVGLQALTGALIVYVTEMFPKASRGRNQSLLLAVGLLGVPVMAWAARFIVPLDESAWRWLLLLPVLGVISAVFAQFLLPESVRWLELNGRGSEAEGLVRRLEDEAIRRSGTVLPEPVEFPAEPQRGLSDLLKDSYSRRAVVVASVVMSFGILSLFGFNSWVPTLLTEHGYSTKSALGVTSILSLAPILGALAAVPFIDRFERKYIGALLSVVIAAGMLTFAYTDSGAVLIAAGFVVTMFLQTSTATLYTYLPEIFPTSLRGIGAGMANGIGRLAGIGGGMVVAALLAGLGFQAVLVATALFAIISGAAFGLFGENTKGRALEEIAPSAAQDGRPHAGVPVKAME